MSDLVISPAPSPALPALASAMSEQARAYAKEAAAENTRRAYRAAWADFTGWCAAAGLDPLPCSPEAVGSFLAARAPTHKAASLSLRLVAIGQAMRLSGHRLDTRHPAIRETMKGIRRIHGTAASKKDAATSPIIRDAVDALARQDGLRPLRDRALLLVGFAAALRRSELVALDVGDVTITTEGMILTLRRAKTDQEGRGTEIAIPYGASERTCPVLALQQLLQASGIQADAVFRSVSRYGRLSARLSDRDVARVVKAAVEAVGHDPKAFAGHSLRSGFITTAARAGVPEAHIQNQSRHKSLPVLRGYIRRGSLFVDNAAARVGL